MKMQYTEEQIVKANQTDLVSFLNAQGEQLMKSGKEYRWKKHDSVTVSGNRWYSSVPFLQTQVPPDTADCLLSALRSPTGVLLSPVSIW